jgi:hypothetical protein
MDKKFWLAKYNEGSIYLNGKASIGGGAAVCAAWMCAQKFRTREGCQAFIGEWDLADRFTPTEYEVCRG